MFVAMITRNGAEFLPEQLASIGAQISPPDALFVSDDRSTDNTMHVVRQARVAFPIHSFQGPGQGIVANMFSLLRRVPAGAVALADQDDIWSSARLDLIEGRDCARPTLTVCRRAAVDRRGRRPRLLPPPDVSRCDFDNALVQNHAPGNATILNRAAADLVRMAIPHLRHLPAFHDWFLYQLVLGAGGAVVFRRETGLHYRAHHANLVGPARGVSGVVRRAKGLWSGKASHWITQQALALADVQDFLTTPHARSLERLLAQLEDGRSPVMAGYARQSRWQTRALDLFWRPEIAQRLIINSRESRI